MLSKSVAALYDYDKPLQLSPEASRIDLGQVARRRAERTATPYHTMEREQSGKQSVEYN